MQTHPEIPNLKIAKVGKQRKRDKGGALPWWLGGGSAGSGGIGGAAMAGAAGSALGRFGGLAALAGKVGVAALLAALCAGAYNLGVSLRPDDAAFAARKQAKPFAEARKAKYGGDLSKLPGAAKATGDSVGMVSGSLDGMTPEERAAAAAKAEADAKAQNEKDAKTAAAAADVPAAPASPPADAAAPAPASPAPEPGKKPGVFSRIFGALTQNLGSNHSGLIGGAGLSGGVGRGFDSLTIKGASGKIGAFSSPGRARVASARSAQPGLSNRRGALGQLKNASIMSGLARRDQGEGSAVMARQAFEGAASAPQTAITGGGAGQGKGPADTPPDANPPPSVGGGPTESAPGGGDAAPPPAPPGHEITKWKGLVNMAKMLLMIASVLMMVAFLLGLWANALGPVAPLAVTLRTIAMYMAYAAAALGAIVVLLGLMIIGMGQMKQGLILTTIGALVAVMAFMAAQGLKPETDVVNPGQAFGTIMPSQTVLTNSVSNAALYGGALGGAATSGGGAATLR